jgi:3-oxoacyl-[acyl-carrier-protein] synthase II
MIVITGMGAVTPYGRGAGTLFEGWVSGTCAIEDGEARCTDFDPGEVLSRKDAHRTDRFTQLAMVASVDAMEEAWGDELPYPSERVACILGTGFGGINSVEEELDHMREAGPRKVSPLGVPRLMGNAGAAMISLHAGLEGETYGLMGACAAGTQAIGDAKRLIEVGAADAVVVGGSDAHSSDYFKAAYRNMGATSREGISRPWDRRRDGFVPGEGAGIVVLEREEAAARRGARPLGLVLGYGGSSDAHHLTAPRPDAAGAERAIRRALADADADPADISYVNAHGTSTQLNDRAETAAIEQALGDAARSVRVSSLKSAIGHLQGGAGAAERHRARSAQRGRAPDAGAGGARRGARPRLRAARGRAAERERRSPADRHQQLVRVRRSQRVPRAAGDQWPPLTQPRQA